MSVSAGTVRVRYPFKAIAVVVLAGLLFLAELVLLGLCMMPLVPLVPVFVTIMVGQACLLSSVVNTLRAVLEGQLSIGAGGDSPTREPARPAPVPFIGSATDARQPGTGGDGFFDPGGARGIS